jgi:hypothetical protein
MPSPRSSEWSRTRDRWSCERYATITERERLRSIEAKVDQTLALLQQLVGILTRLADLDGDADEFGLGAFGETVKRLAESAPGGRQAEAGEEPARARHRAG